jgi:hypothetical protein
VPIGTWKSKKRKLPILERLESKVASSQSEQPKLSPEGGETKSYVPGEILVKFRDGTTDQTKKAIQKEVHLETIRLISKPNLYLMKILDGSSVERVLERLGKFKEVKYAEPNYIRTIH